MNPEQYTFDLQDGRMMTLQRTPHADERNVYEVRRTITDGSAVNRYQFEMTYEFWQELPSLPLVSLRMIAVFMSSEATHAGR